MSSHPQTKPPPVVFISYAHESDALRAAVATLADWLGRQGCKLLTDHAYLYRPPPEGWQAWMLGCIHQADIVLVVCTPKLRQRYEKTADLDSGRGATYEGAIVTQHIYDDVMRNVKFYPILPDEGDEGNIPTALKSWWNGHRFPTGNEGIRRMIFDEPVEHKPPSDAADNPNVSDRSKRLDSHHQKLANRLLSAAGAKPFYEALKVELHDEIPQSPAPQSPTEMVQFFADCDYRQVLSLFIVVRCALTGLPQDIADRGQIEQAAVSLYCLAACRLVDRATLLANHLADGYLLRVPSSEHVICAIIATALFGGELRLLPSEKKVLPHPEYVFDVHVPAAGDRIEESFMRAVYVALFENTRSTTHFSLDSDSLDEQQIKDIAARLRTYRKVKKASLALIIYGLGDTRPCESFAKENLVPIMFPVNEATSALFGIDAGTLLAEIKEFWAELEVLPRTGQATHSPAES